MKTSLRKNSRGIAHIAILLVVIVIATIGGIGYYVYSKNSSSAVSNATPAQKQAADACNTLYNDKDLCKFASSYSGKGPYKATFTNKDASGATTLTTFSVATNGDYNTKITQNGTEVTASTSINGETYIKDEASGSWTKYPKADSSAPSAISPTSDLKIDTNEASKPADQRITYKNLGKEACGSSTCFKYQIIDPSAPHTTSTVWFGTKDYQLHQWDYVNADGNHSSGTFTYTAVTIPVPSPVKDASVAPAAPTAQQIQDAINQAQAASQ
jgi:uncharacterized protein (UPF0333 family)